MKAPAAVALPRQPPPASAEELRLRAASLVGTTVGELACALGWPLPARAQAEIDERGSATYEFDIIWDPVEPPPSADADGDGVVNTTEGHPFYGHIGTSLTTTGDTGADSALAVERFPGGSSYTYERTLDLNAETAQSLKAGNAVVVVHGVDPAKMPAAAAAKKSDLDPKLPAAATLPAACGTLAASQMEAMPEGGADTGVATAVDHDATATVGIASAVAGGLALAGAVLFVARRRARD